MRNLLLAAVLVLAPLAGAGVVYDFVTTMETPRIAEKVAGRIWVEGESYRAEFERGGSRMVVISRDADRTATLLDPVKSTWSNRSRVSTDVRSAELFVFPVPGGRVKGKPKIAHHLETASVIAGEVATQHVIEAEFDVHTEVSGSPLRGRLRMIVRIWTSESLPKLPMQHRGLRTGYAVVDRELEKAEARVRGMVLRHELEVTRTFDGGPPQVERTRTEITKLERADIDATQFEVPETFTYIGPTTIKRE